MLILLRLAILLLVLGISILNRFYIGVGLYYTMIVALFALGALYWRLTLYISLKETGLTHGVTAHGSASLIEGEALIKGRIVLTQEAIHFFTKKGRRVIESVTIPNNEVTQITFDGVVHSKRAVVITTDERTYGFVTKADLPQLGNILPS
ncbi:MAG: hypothetical protein WC954_07295 [Sphaerochaeta sp.]